MISEKLISGKWYHGDRRKTDFKDRKFDVEDYTRSRNAVGPGIYFTRMDYYARGYAEPDGYLYTCTVKLDPRRVLVDNTAMDKQKLATFVTGCKDDDLLLNYDQNLARAKQKAVEMNMSSSTNMLDAAIGIYNDLYQRDSRRFAEMMVKIGYDAMMHRPNAENYPKIYELIVYDPNKITILSEEPVKGTGEGLIHIKSFGLFE